jgi:hypothetical protein
MFGPKWLYFRIDEAHGISSFSLKPSRNPEAKGVVPLDTVHIQEFSGK